ncbi:hypothetical protein AGLY_016315 [Aphis glycines]|uniref:Uncharacterized protein n=1 Tax=Aphis glycines TaxID=307491 RepID=A0A6G0T0D6_APHGL|nr:hypothetical protein AGLY_016315 [Aphis glycines]
MHLRCYCTFSNSCPNLQQQLQGHLVLPRRRQLDVNQRRTTIYKGARRPATADVPKLSTTEHFHDTQPLIFNNIRIITVLLSGTSGVAKKRKQKKFEESKAKLPKITSSLRIANKDIVEKIEPDISNNLRDNFTNLDDHLITAITKLTDKKEEKEISTTVERHKNAGTIITPKASSPVCPYPLENNNT